jgi:hypothetical protein
VTPLFTDSTNGLRVRLQLTTGSGSSLTTSQIYDGPINFTNVGFGVLAPNATHTVTITVYLPDGVPNAHQAITQNVSFAFTLVE